MLTRLAVQNLAIVESAEIEFGEGLNIITGETGAGKSVLMGALELVLGARADASAVRDGAKDARIEAEFALSGEAERSVAALLEEHGLPPSEDGMLLVRRIISSSGGGRVWVNDAATTVQTLRTAGRLLVDVHGPNDHQSFLDETFQRRLLDSYGKIDVSVYAGAWQTLSALRDELAALQGDTTDVAEACDRLLYPCGAVAVEALRVLVAVGVRLQRLAPVAVPVGVVHAAEEGGLAIGRDGPPAAVGILRDAPEARRGGSGRGQKKGQENGGVETLHGYRTRLS